MDAATVGTRYEINSLEDFLQIPDDRLEACLAEFALGVRMWRTVLARNERVAGDPHEVQLIPRSFVWTDGGPEAPMSITIAATPESVGRRHSKTSESHV